VNIYWANILFMFGINTVHAAKEGIHVVLSPYVVGEFYGIPITATMITTWLTMFILVVGIVLLRSRLKLVPGKVQIMFELMIGGVFDYMSDILESRKLAKTYFPIVMTIFIFILSLNWFGLLPGVTAIGFYEYREGLAHFIPLLYPPATDLNITIAFALIAFFTIEIAGVVAIGIFKYAGKFINFKSPLAFLIGIIELLSELARLISFSFRLFGNIFAGKTLLVVAIFFVPYIIPVPIMAFEIFVGFIQAFVFSILTLFFIKLAVTPPH